MKIFEGKTQREKYLIIGLGIAVIFSAYVAVRVSKLNGEIVKLEREYKKENKKLTKLNKETGNARPSGQLEKKLKQIERKLTEEKQQMSGYEFEFVDLSNEVVVQDHIRNISLSAEKNKLRILSKFNERQPLMKMIGKSASKANNKAIGNQLQRRMFKLKLRGSFRSTYDFIKSLQEQDYGVLITRIRLNADNENTYNGLRLIITDITLAI